MRRQASHLSRAKQSAWYAALAGLIVGLLMLVGSSPGLASNGRSAPSVGRSCLFREVGVVSVGDVLCS
jgi:hypothetical protein